MLILVAVTVSILAESDLIGSAEKAGNAYKDAVNNEQNLGQITIGGKTYSSIEEYIEQLNGGSSGGGEVALPRRTATLTHKETTPNSDGSKTVSLIASVENIPTFSEEYMMSLLEEHYLPDHDTEGILLIIGQAYIAQLGDSATEEQIAAVSTAEGVYNNIIGPQYFVIEENTNVIMEYNTFLTSDGDNFALTNYGMKRDTFLKYMIVQAAFEDEEQAQILQIQMMLYYSKDMFPEFEAMDKEDIMKIAEAYAGDGSKYEDISAGMISSYGCETEAEAAALLNTMFRIESTSEHAVTEKDITTIVTAMTYYERYPLMVITYPDGTTVDMDWFMSNYEEIGYTVTDTNKTEDGTYQFGFVGPQGEYAEETVNVVMCEHNYTNGTCIECGKVCQPHRWTNNGTCEVCGKECEHNYTNSRCTVCGKVCEHSYTNGTCTVCGKECEHSYTNSTCTICGKICEQHSYTNRICTICGKTLEFSTTDQFATTFGTIEVIWLDKNNNVIEKPLAPVVNSSYMTPVVWSNSQNKFVEATAGQEWYKYIEGTGISDNNSSKWANVEVKPTSSSTASYFVWIPRYAYRITYYNNEDLSASTTQVSGYCDGRGIVDVNGNVKYALDAGIETVEKNGKSYIVHPAFMDDRSSSFSHGGWTEDLAGIWVAKYEMSGTDGALTSIPNASSLRLVNIANTYNYSKNYSSTLKSHLMKNSEWGAVAYLTHSQYGRNGTEISINSANTTTAGGNYITNKLQSSTGNVYGIYDLNGTCYEYVAAYNNSYNREGAYFGGTSGNTNSNYKPTTGTHFAYEANGASNEYVTAYTNDTKTSYGTKIYEVGKIGDATKEVYRENGNSYNWNSDFSGFVDSSYPFFLRGGLCYYDANAGVFYSDASFGNGDGNSSFRVVCSL